MNVYEKLMNVQSKLKAPKNQYNAFGKYNYRSCEDILEGLKPLLAEYKAIVTLKDEIVYIESRHYIKAIATFTDIEKGESIEVSALAREDETKKGMDLAQVTGSVSSYARKYSLNGLFCIDDNKDSDATNTHGKGSDSTGNTTPPSNKKPTESNTGLSEGQIKRLVAIVTSSGHNMPQAKAAILKKYNITELEQLTKEQYDHICKSYEGAKK